MSISYYTSREKGIEQREKLLKELNYNRDKLIRLQNRKSKLIKALDDDISKCSEQIRSISGEIELIDAMFSEDAAIDELTEIAHYI